MKPLTGAEMQWMLNAFIRQSATSEADAIANLKQEMHAHVLGVMDVEVMLLTVAEVMDIEPEDAAIELDLKRFRRGNELIEVIEHRRATQ